MVQVSLNGVHLIPQHDYTVKDNHVVFTEAPRIGDFIQLASSNYKMAMYGNDFSYKFPIPIEVVRAQQLEELTADLAIYMDHPTVKDQLDQLRVAIELVRNHPKTD